MKRLKKKDAIMQSFKEHQVDVLVSTTVIEVGVQRTQCDRYGRMDADRFGLSQLLPASRPGWSGRQAILSLFLVANPKTDSGKQRMKIMTETTNGFVLAEEDLKMRVQVKSLEPVNLGFQNFKWRIW